MEYVKIFSMAIGVVYVMKTIAHTLNAIARNLELKEDFTPLSSSEKRIYILAVIFSSILYLAVGFPASESLF